MAQYSSWASLPLRFGINTRRDDRDEITIWPRMDTRPFGVPHQTIQNRLVSAAPRLTCFRCNETDKFLLVYVILKLKLIKGKCILFVNEVDRCYRLKLFLEQFSIKSCVLNSELPLNSRPVPFQGS